jgi:hypothetical protein
MHCSQVAMVTALFFLIFFYMVPITFVQSLANVKMLSKNLPFLKFAHPTAMLPVFTVLQAHY